MDHLEAILAEIPAETPQAAIGLQDLTGLLQAVTTLPALHQEDPAVTRPAGVQVHILPAAQAVAAVIPEAGSPAVDHPEVQADPTAVAAAPEAVAEEGNH